MYSYTYNDSIVSDIYQRLRYFKASGYMHLGTRTIALCKHGYTNLKLGSSSMLHWFKATSGNIGFMLGDAVWLN